MACLGWLLNLGFAGGTSGVAAPVGYRADSIRAKISSVEIVHMACVGAIPGVTILAAAARNEPGVGRLRGDGSKLAWRAPGSSAWGPWVTAPGDGSLLLEDGADCNKWVRVQVYTAYLHSGQVEERIFCQDLYANGPPHDDVTAAEATAGDVETYTISLVNESEARVENLHVWLDASTPSLEISDDGIVWVSPTDEASALGLGNLAAQATATLYLRRTITPGALSDPDVLTLIHYAFDGF